QTFSPLRKLTAEEKQELERNRIWGDEVDDRQLGWHGREKWEPAPLIVWARPGEDGSAMEAESWLDEHGKLLAQSPWVMEGETRVSGKKATVGRFNGDILLPAADRKYRAIQPGNRDHLGALRIRHLTVERNASYEVRYELAGNLWVKDGAELGRNTQTGGFGSGDDNKHTFARFCNYHDLPEPKKGYAAEISHWVHIDTGETGSLEVLGISGGAGDRLTHGRGTLIVSGDSFMGNGNRGAFYSQPGTTTIMLDGSGMGCPRRTVTGSLGTYGIGGTLMFGHPEKPLTRDLIFSANLFDYKNTQPNARPAQRTVGASYVLGDTGRMVVHSSDPTKARVVFRPRSADLPGPQVPNWLAHYVPNNRQPPLPGLWDEPDMPNGMVAVLLGETDFNGVVFDGFYKAGIFVDPAKVAQWRNVTWGPGNHGKPNELMAWPTSHNPSLTIEPDGAYGKVGERVEVKVLPAVEGMPVHYTLDGSVPTTNSPVVNGALNFDRNTTLTAAAFKDGYIYGTFRRAEFRFDEHLNLAPFAVVKATGSQGSRVPENAIDLKMSTSWRGLPSVPQTLDLTWDKDVRFGQIRLHGSLIGDWKLLVGDGDGWRELASGTEGFPLDLAVGPVTTSKLRLEILTLTGDRPVVNQIEVIAAD
ncbi:MAG: FN3 associated domain-containing protein, partial [Verrucomicrobiia bacterium]